MFETLSSTDQSLLNDFQRDFPLCPNPFEEIALRLGITQSDVLARLTQLRQEGRITRVGATIKPNTAGASTLAALAVPEHRIGEVAEIVGQEKGVNHSYLREHEWNLWFVATAPDAETLEICLENIRQKTALTLLDLRLVRPFNIDLGFCLNDRNKTPHPPTPETDLSVLEPTDRPILNFLSSGLTLVPAPFGEMADRLGRSEAEILERISALTKAGIISRLGVIVRHRSIGWAANAMVVWRVAPENIENAGKALAAHPGITLCYQRNTVPGLWPYTLYCMIHGRTREEAHEILAGARVLEPLQGVDHEVLFSSHCFRQRGATLHSRANAQADPSQQEKKERQVRHAAHAPCR